MCFIGDVEDNDDEDNDDEDNEDEDEDDENDDDDDKPRKKNVKKMDSDYDSDDEKPKKKSSKKETVVSGVDPQLLVKISSNRLESSFNTKRIHSWMGITAQYIITKILKKHDTQTENDHIKRMMLICMILNEHFKEITKDKSCQSYNSVIRELVDMFAYVVPHMEQSTKDNLVFRTIHHSRQMLVLTEDNIFAYLSKYPTDIHNIKFAEFFAQIGLDKSMKFMDDNSHCLDDIPINAFHQYVRSLDANAQEKFFEHTYTSHKIHAPNYLHSICISFPELMIKLYDRKKASVKKTYEDIGFPIFVPEMTHDTLNFDQITKLFKMKTNESVYTCKICLHEEVDRFLSCGHVFCSTCITSIAKADDEDTCIGKIRCPYCSEAKAVTKMFIDIDETV